ncbi:MAG: SusD/RagB family nutrient-binding outer membrane lipoprotein [Dysgonamonadaceae bacterium]|jgi:hypothetical protein|nr:SusD/RagB family nutrient-binding outer membrane lipoprotein [Dysgonamonadaceae bacterium]
MKKIVKISLLFSLILSFTACEDYLDVNYNVDAPAEVDAYLYLSGIIQNSQGFYWDIRATGPLTQMMGTSSYTSFATHYYSLASDAGGEAWRVVYWLYGMNLENLINQSIEAEDWTLAGIGYAIKAYGWDVLTKFHADLPMKQAFVAGLLSHDYDYQEDIYPQIREWAYTAIEYLEKEDKHDYGTKISANDWIYAGDKSKWIKFAYAVIVRNLASLTNKNDFKEKYAQELIDAANKSFQSSADDAAISVAGGSASAPYSGYNNFWGTYRGNLSWSYWQHDYAVQMMTGTIPKYDESTGQKYVVPDTLFVGTDTIVRNDYYPYELAENQIICDTALSQKGHYDPRVAVKLITRDNTLYQNLSNADSVKAYKYYGGTFTGTTSPIGWTAPSFYGRIAVSSTTTDGKGRWLYHDEAPYILTTCAEIKLDLAEAYWKIGQKANALAAFKEAVKEDLAFSAKYIKPGTSGQAVGGDKIATALFNTLAAEYAAGPFVDGLTEDNFTLSHIMMQKFVALYPWGASEVWVDQRKYHYDIQYSGDVPSQGNGWERSRVNMKWDSDPTKVYKGFYLAPAPVQGRNGSYNALNNGSPCYRVRPRYNSEYMWNIPSLEKLKPISGTETNYHCSIPWFAYPGDAPRN